MRRFTILTLLTVLAGLFAACGGAPAAAPTTAPAQPTTAPAATPIPPTAAPTQAPAATEAPAAPAGFPLTVENCGRTVTFERPPERVITTWQALPELMVTLGLGDRIIGTQWNNQFAPPPDIAEAFGSLPVLSKEYASKEAIFTANPDMILSAGLSWDFDPNNGSPSLDEVEAAGIKVFGLSDNCTADSHVTIDDMYADILTIGRIFGVEDRASALIDDMRARIADVQDRVSGRAPVKAFFDAGGEGPVGTAGKGLQHDMITLAGGDNIFGDRPNYYESVSLEEVAARQPEIFVVDTWDDPSYIDTRAEWLFTTFSETPAAKEQRFVEVPGIFIYYASVRFADGIELMAKAFHPDAFGDVAAPAAARTQYPLTITGCGGHTATFTEAPKTTVTMDPQAFELMFWLGLGETQIAAGPQPLPAVPEQFQAAAQNVTTIASGESDYPSKEALLAAKPDFVYGSYTSGFSGDAVFSEDDWAGRGVNTYWSFGIGGCTTDDPAAPRTTLDPVFKDIENLGQIFDVQDRANALISQMKADLAAAVATVDASEPLRVTTFEIAEYSDGKPSIYGSRSTVNAIIAMAGGTNAFADIGDAYALTNWEEYVKRDPEVILLIAYPAAIPQAWDDAEKLLTELPVLQHVSAVENRRFVRVTFPEVGAGGVRNVDAVKKLAETLAKLK